MEVIIRNNVLEGVEDPVGYKAFLDAELAAKPMKDWERAMAETDAKLPRYVEDIYDVLTPEQKAALPRILRENIADKKRIRLEKP